MTLTLAIFVARLARSQREWLLMVLTIVVGAFVSLSGSGNTLDKASITFLVVAAAGLQAQLAMRHAGDTGLSDTMHALLGGRAEIFRVRCIAGWITLSIPVAVIVFVECFQLPQASPSTWLSLLALNTGAVLSGQTIGSVAGLACRGSRPFGSLSSIMVGMALLALPATGGLLKRFSVSPLPVSLTVLGFGGIGLGVVNAFYLRYRRSSRVEAWLTGAPLRRSGETVLREFGGRR